MPLRRFRVHTLMLATGAIAFNLAVGRALGTTTRRFSDALP